MMKRDESLKTLSWEHHHGLVVAFRLQQGLKNAVHIRQLANYVLYTWHNSLKHHFWQEEKIISPLLQHSDRGRQLLAKMKEDHQAFRALVARLGEDRNDKQTISVFAELLNCHIRFEERELFAFLQKNLSDSQLTDMGTFLDEHHQPVCDNWQPRFWEKTET